MRQGENQISVDQEDDIETILSVFDVVTIVFKVMHSFIVANYKMKWSVHTAQLLCLLCIEILKVIN